MPETIENYSPQYLLGPLRRQAWRVWAASGLVAFVWLALILAPPLLAALGLASAGNSIFSFFGYICHQMPDRSFHIDGSQVAVCSRCFGVYFGLIAGVLAYPLWRWVEDIEPLSRIWLFAAMVPIGVDWSLTMFGIWENTHLTRFVTGMILGAACATYILPALVEIVRYRSKVPDISRSGNNLTG